MRVRLRRTRNNSGKTPPNTGIKELINISKRQNFHSFKAKLIKTLLYATQFYAKCLKTILRIFRLKSQFFQSLVYYCRKAEIFPFESESYRPREHTAIARHWVPETWSQNPWCGEQNIRLMSKLAKLDFKTEQNTPKNYFPWWYLIT